METILLVGVTEGDSRCGVVPPVSWFLAAACQSGRLAGQQSRQTKARMSRGSAAGGPIRLGARNLAYDNVEANKHWQHGFAHRAPWLQMATFCEPEPVACQILHNTKDACLCRSPPLLRGPPLSLSSSNNHLPLTGDERCVGARLVFSLLFSILQPLSSRDQTSLRVL